MTDAAPLLRPGLLAGTTLLAAPPAAVKRLGNACAAAGAEVVALDADLLDESATQAAGVPCDAILVDAAALAGGLDDAGLRAALDATWSAVHAVVAGVFVSEPRAGKVLLAGPRPGDGPHAEALRAGLENLARTTSIEWSRFGITIAALLPGPETTDAELAELVAYLVSPAGDYFSGCALTLG